MPTQPPAPPPGIRVQRADGSDLFIPEDPVLDISPPVGLEQLRTSVWGNALQADIDLEVHPHARWALSLVPRINGQWSDVVKISVYTHGGFDSDKDEASWAFAALAQRASGEQEFIGAAFGPVVIQEDAEHWAWARTRSAGTAEASAVIWALSWSLSTPKGFRLRFHIDSCVTGGHVDMTRTSPVNRELTATLQALRITAEIYHGSVSSLHIKAHSGAPWDEVVDSLCSRVISGAVMPRPSANINSIASDPKRAQCLWLTTLNDEQLRTRGYPPLCDGRLVITETLPDTAMPFSR